MSNIKEKFKKIIDAFFAEENYQVVMILIFAIGIVIRVAFVSGVSFYGYNYDLRYAEGGMYPYGHLDYMRIIYETGHLPRENIYTFSHPPLHHMVCALWWKFLSLFYFDANSFLESLHVISFVISVLTLMVWRKILEELNLNHKIKIILFVMVSINTYFMVAAGYVNNDPLSWLLALCSVLYLIKWIKNNSYKNIIIMAIATGLSVMTKLNMGILAFPIGFMFIYTFFDKFKRKDITSIKALILQFAIFAIVSLSLGLWFPIRNKILFDQSIIYVFDIKDLDLYIEDEPLLKRLSPISEEFFFVNPMSRRDTNIVTYLLKTSMSGEFQFTTKVPTIYYLALTFNTLHILFMCIITAQEFINKKRKPIQWALLSLIVINYITFISMNLRLPYGCSMDARYVIPAAFGFFLLYGIELNNSLNKNQKSIYYSLGLALSYFAFNSICIFF